jgi:hypothetical protein
MLKDYVLITLARVYTVAMVSRGLVGVRCDWSSSRARNNTLEGLQQWNHEHHLSFWLRRDRPTRRVQNFEKRP